MKKKGNKKKSMKETCSSSMSCSGGCGYFLGFLGSAVYYISASQGFWGFVVAILKSLVWPAFLVYEVLKYVGA